jgi:putative heme-binding domain-containing protein
VEALVKSDSKEAFPAVMVALVKLDKSKENGTEREHRLAKEAFANAAKLDLQHEVFESEAAKLSPASVWADVALLKLADRKTGAPEAREAAKQALDTGWTEPKRRAQILYAVALGEQRSYKDKVLESLDDPDKAIAQAAKRAAGALRLDRNAIKANTPLIASFTVPDAIAAVLKTHGEIKLGEQLFTQQGCVNCHTAHPGEPLRGPYLGNIATTYKRPELAENILLPNKTIAQGFTTHHFEMKDGEEYDGFVTLEAADKVTIRNAAAQEIVIPVKNIAKRTKLERSIMPEGLVANLSVKEFASLLDYLEALAKQ